jgi:DNA invertase Pin-like site-specific DNA recombinase
MTELITPQRYARKLKVSRQTVYNRIKSGEIISKKISGVIFVVIEKKLKQINPETDAN